MDTNEVLTELTRLNVHLTAKGNNLSIAPPDDYIISPALLEQIKKNKKAIITLLSTNLYQEPPPLVSVPRDRDIPLSFAQQRLWFIDQFEEEVDTSNNLPWTLQLTGKLNITALQKTFQTIVDRHESLRTTFQTVEGKAVQIIADKLPLDFPVIEATEAEVSIYTHKNTTHVFDLTTGPLITVALLQLTTEEHILLINMHHIISDGWSGGVLIREMTVLYGAYAKGEPSPLVPLPVQYADFSIWQRGWLQGSVLKEHVEYWKQQLDGAPSLLELPTDYPRPAKQTTCGAMEAFQITKALSDQVITFARKERVTLFMLLMTAFQILLSRYSRQTDICVGTPIANRKQSALANLIGFFVNTLVIRTQVDSQQSFKVLLKQVRSASLAAFRHQDLPFEQVIEAVNPERNMSRSPLFQVVIALHNTGSETLTLDNIAISPGQSELQTTQFDLTLNLSETNQGLSGGVVYNTNLFSATTIKRLIQHFQTLLTGIIENPEQKLFNLPLHSPSEQHTILYEWNKTDTNFPQDVSIHSLFETQAEKTPTAIAVTFEEQQLTYQALNQRSNQLAHYLIEQGVGPESKVGLCVERSLEMVTGLLGVLKAGGTYVPIDPEYPSQRINHLISDSNSVVLLTQEKLLNTIPSQTSRPAFCFDRDGETLASYSTLNPNVFVDPLNLAYVIYTSGSTGQPKGVAVPHCSLVKLCHWHQQTFTVTTTSKATQIAGIGFDAMAWEVWPYLTIGAQLFLVPPDLTLMPESFIEWINASGITHCFVPTPLTDKLLAETWPTRCQLQFLLTGGDRLNRLASTNLPFKLINNYGPTEVTVVTTSGQIHSNDISTPSIGRPISNTCVYILDSDLNPVPIGVPGELFIGNTGLARGYLNQVDLTAENFIPDLFTNTPGQRLYRSGDLVYYRPDGSIDFVRRVDDQVKIRGFRIELREIENVLNEQADVRNALVLALSRNDTAQTHYLTAYVVPEQDIPLDQDQLRTALQVVLPNYMVPSFFISLDQFPLTANGKVDKKALPIPDANTLQTKEFVAPTTEIERQLTNLWAELLRINADKIGVHANFFELGGDSILSLQIIARARTQGIQFTPKQLFEFPTVAELAKVVKQATKTQAEQGQVVGSVPLLPIQHWFFENVHTDLSHWNQAFLLTVPVTLDKNHLTTALQALLQHHDVLRLRFAKDNEDHWSQQLPPDNEQIALSIIDLSTIARKSQRTALEQESAKIQTQLDIQQGPIIRVGWFQLGDNQSDRLLIAVHHLAVDMVSWRILLEDLTTAYQQLDSGENITLTAKTSSYKAWSERLQIYAQSELLHAEFNHWCKPGQYSIKPLPQDYTAGIIVNTEASSKGCSIHLDKEATQALLQQVPAVYNTQINDVLLTALVMAFQQWTGEDALLFDLEGHGREDFFEEIDLSRTVGWFTSLYPVCLHLTLNTDPGTALKSIKEQLRAIPNRGIGYGLLRYCCKDTAITKELQAQPSPQISFNYLGQFDQMKENEKLLQVATESAGPSHNSRQDRPHLLEVGGSIIDGCLQINIGYSNAIYNTKTIKTLGGYLLKALQSLIKHCINPNVGEHTPSDFPDANLSASKLALLLHQVAPPKDRNNIEAIYPLSPVQIRMLSHSQIDPTSGVCFEQFTWNFSGDFNRNAFRKSWAILVERHAVFRTFFTGVNNKKPLQIVLKHIDLPWCEENWLTLSAGEKLYYLQSRLVEDQQKGFSINQAPLMRLQLIQTTEECFYFIWSFHHALLDGWSVSIIFKELLNIYRATLKKQILALPAVRPYQHYIRWLNNRNSTPEKIYWKKYLQGFRTPVPTTAAGQLKQIDPNSGYQICRLTLTEKHTSALEKLAHQNQLTINKLMQATWAVALHRYTGERDIIFGNVVSGRPPTIEGIENMVGLFINALPLRIYVDPFVKILPWIQRLHQSDTTIEFQHTSLTNVQDFSELDSKIALYNSIYVFNNVPLYTTPNDFNETKFKMALVKHHWHNTFPLSMEIGKIKNLEIRISYDNTLLNPKGVEQLLSNYQLVLERIVGNPYHCISDIL